jgi:ABC-2 type transport system permease protein
MSRPATFPPPAFGRVLALLVGLAWRRFSNGTAVGLAAFGRKRPASCGRQATPRKRRGGAVGMLFLLAIWLFSAMNMSTQTLRQAGRAVDAPTNLSVEDLSDVPRLAREQGSRGGDRVDRGPRLPWPDRSLWPAAEAEPAWLRLQAVLLLAMFLAVLITQFGMANQDLAKVESSLEWLFTFPVSARTLFAAKIGEYVALNGFLWLMVAPSLCCLFLAAGRGWLAVPLALGFALLQAVCMATVRLVAECWLRRHVSPAGIKNVQAACTILGMTLLMACFAIPSNEWLMRQAVEAGSIAGPPLFWLPSGWPAAACRQGLLAAVFAGGTCATGLVLAAGLSAAGALTRDGLVTAGATLVGARQPAARRPMAGGIGIATKDLLLLLRDRNFLVQTLVVPLAMAGAQAAINGEATLAALASPTHGPAIAFGLGCYVLMFSALQVLGAEGQGLWLLYTVPRRLDDLLLRKAAVWGGIALIYTTAVLAAAAVWQKAISLEFVVAAAMAVVGVFLHAFIGAGIGTLATDPLETDPRRRIHPDRMFLFMLLAGFYGYAIYTPSLWAKLAQLVLSTGLAIAVWQKVRDQLPYLLDPVSAPPPRIGLADGMLAAVAFFVLQGIIAVILTLAEVPLPPGGILLVAFAGAGAVVTAATLFSFWRRGVPDVLAEVGLRRGADGAGPGAVASIAIGLATGAAAVGGAWLYLAAVPRVPALRALALEQKAQAAAQEAAFGVGWIALLAILAAPLCEEYIFRGLVFRGLRRTSSAALACVASAALFAIVHPPLSVIPVFGLGLACGLAFESTKTLLAPIAAHALYNAVVLLVLAPAFLERLPEPPPQAPEETPEQAAAGMRQEVPQAMAVAIAGRFVIASDVPEEARGRVLADLAAVQGRCAALVGRGDPGRGPAIRVYYPGTQRDLRAVYRTIMDADIPLTHGLVTWSPTRAWASADVGSGSLAHEAVHVFVQSDWPQVPGWLNESLAVALGCPKVGMQITDRLATADLWLHVGRRALAADRWTPVAVTFGYEGSDYGSCDTMDLEIAAGATIKVGPLLTGRLLVRMLDETGRLDRFYQGWRDRGGAAGALDAIGLMDAAVLDRELRAWTAARPPDSAR